MGRAERLFIGLAAFGKLSFFGLLVGSWAVGGLPLRLPLLATGDLFFGLLFVAWLVGVSGVASPSALPADVAASRLRG
jgi:hypothetical protein